jgi:hypothetical protein
MMVSPSRENTENPENDPFGVDLESVLSPLWKLTTKGEGPEEESKPYYTVPLKKKKTCLKGWHQKDEEAKGDVSLHPPEGG